jgi:hypothetical protein
MYVCMYVCMCVCVCVCVFRSLVVSLSLSPGVLADKQLKAADKATSDAATMAEVNEDMDVDVDGDGKSECLTCVCGWWGGGESVCVENRGRERERERVRERMCVCDLVIRGDLLRRTTTCPSSLSLSFSPSLLPSFFLSSLSSFTRMIHYLIM